MDEWIDTAERKVLVDIVRMTQRRHMKGNLGDWKEFLNSNDKKFGASLSDPGKRPHEVLASFLKTFSRDDMQIFFKVMQHHSNQESLKQLKDESIDSPEQRLVQMTLQHALYPLDYSFLAINEEWIVIKNKEQFMKSTAMVAVDCEMVLCEDGTDALVKVCVVDQNLEVKLHELVKPDKEIMDYRTEITGVSPQDLEGVTCSLTNIQRKMKKLLSKGAILVGHSLHNDLRVLKLDYAKVIDTAYIFQNAYIFRSKDGSTRKKRPSLDYLCKAVLGYEVRKDGAPHNCQDDACAAIKLVLAKINHGVDKAFPLKRSLQEYEEVRVSKKAKMDPKIEDAPAASSEHNTDAQLKENEVLTEQMKRSESEIESLREQLSQKDVEIESLREQLKAKDFDISMLHKMITSLKKRS